MGRALVHPRLWRGLPEAGVVLLLFLLAAWLGPQTLSGAFQGGDGTLWVAPFFVWMGLLAGLWTLLFRAGRFGDRQEERFLAGAAFFFAGLLLFVSLQRFTSGLRGLEAFQEFMGYRVAHGPPIFGNPEEEVLGNHYTPLLYILSSLLYRLFPGYYGYGRLINTGAILLAALFVYKATVVAVWRRRSHKGTADGEESQSMTPEGESAGGDPQAATANGDFGGGATAATNRRSAPGQVLGIKPHVLGMWAAALFLATYGPLGKIYDFSLVDPLQAGFIAACLWQFLRDTPRGDAWALLLGGGAVFTKQPGVLTFAAVFALVAWRRRPLWVFWPLAGWGAVAAWLLVATGGRAWQYLAANPGAHTFAPYPLPESSFRLFVLLAPLWVSLFLRRRMAWGIRLPVFLAAQFTASIMGTWVHSGWTNTLIPFIPVLCVAAVHTGGKLRWLWALQLVLGLYNPFATLYPWSSIRAADTRALEMAAQTPGEVWFPTQPYLAPMAGKRAWDDAGVLEAWCASHHDIPGRLREAIAARRISLIIQRKEGEFWFPRVCYDLEQLLQQYYQRYEDDGLVYFAPRGDAANGIRPSRRGAGAAAENSDNSLEHPVPAGRAAGPGIRP